MKYIKDWVSDYIDSMRCARCFGEWVMFTFIFLIVDIMCIPLLPFLLLFSIPVNRGTQK